MAVPIKEILAVAKFLNSKEGKSLVTAAKNGGLASLDVPGQNQNTDDNGKGKWSNKDLENMTQGQKLDAVREIMVGDPTDYAVRAAGEAAKGISNFIGNKSVTDANRMAAAILAANRVNSDRQNSIYGPSKTENAAQVWANEKQRRGENVKNATNEITNVIENLTGLYNQRDDVSRAMQAQMVTQAPGSFYNYANSLQRASQAAKKGGK